MLALTKVNSHSLRIIDMRAGDVGRDVAAAQRRGLVAHARERVGRIFETGCHGERAAGRHLHLLLGLPHRHLIIGRARAGLDGDRAEHVGIVGADRQARMICPRECLRRHAVQQPVRHVLVDNHPIRVGVQPPTASRRQRPGLFQKRLIIEPAGLDGKHALIETVLRRGPVDLVVRQPLLDDVCLALRRRHSWMRIWPATWRASAAAGSHRPTRASMSTVPSPRADGRTFLRDLDDPREDPHERPPLSILMSKRIGLW